MRNAWPGVCALLLAACVGDAPATQDGGPDGASDAPVADASDGGGVSDGPAPDGPTLGCNPTSPFMAPSLLPVVNSMTANDFDGRLSDDQLFLYFSSNRAAAVPDGGDSFASFDLHVAQRSSPTLPFGTPTALANLSVQGVGELHPTVTKDHLRLYYQRYDGVTHRIWTASRSQVGQDFVSPAEVSAINLTAFTGEPFVIGSSQILYFSTGTSTTNSLSRVDLSKADPPTSLGINVGASHIAPTVSEDERVMYFGANGAGNYDIYVTTRASAAVPFGAPVALVGANGSNDDMPAWVSADGCRMYMWSNRGGTSTCTRRCAPTRRTTWVRVRSVVRGAADARLRQVLRREGIVPEHRGDVDLGDVRAQRGAHGADEHVRHDRVARVGEVQVIEAEEAAEAHSREVRAADGHPLRKHRRALRREVDDVHVGVTARRPDERVVVSGLDGADRLQLRLEALLRVQSRCDAPPAELPDGGERRGVEEVRHEVLAVECAERGEDRVHVHGDHRGWRGQLRVDVVCRRDSTGITSLARRSPLIPTSGSKRRMRSSCGRVVAVQSESVSPSGSSPTFSMGCAGPIMPKTTSRTFEPPTATFRVSSVGSRRRRSGGPSPSSSDR